MKKRLWAVLLSVTSALCLSLALCWVLIKKTHDPTKGAHTHNYINYVSDGNATCLDDGTKTAKCEFCEQTKTLPDGGSALGHSFIAYVSNGDFTCTEDGTKTAKCERCEICDTVADTGSARHRYGIYIPNGDATCTTDGTSTASCGVCGHKNTVTDIGSGRHDFANYVYNNDASCTEDGTKTAHCERCNAATDTQTAQGSKLGHLFEEYVFNNDATCTEDGTKTAHCGRCSATDTVVVAGSATGHQYSETFYFNDDYHWRAPVCSCGNAPVTLIRHLIDGNLHCEHCEYQLKASEGLNYLTSADGTYYTVVGGDVSGNLVIPGLFNGKPVKGIESSAFKSNRRITGITLAGSLEFIGADAFADSYLFLSKIIIPEGVQTIGANAFARTHLAEIKLPASLKIGRAHV